MDKNLIDMFVKYFLEQPFSITQLTPHGSARNYFKIESVNYDLLGTIGNDEKENIAFIKLSNHLRSKGISVPKVYISSKDNMTYIQEFLGNIDLFTTIQNSSKDSYLEILKPAIDLLYDFQTKGMEDWDLSHSYPFPQFDENEIIRDFDRLKKRFFANLNFKFSDTDLDQDRDNLINLISEIPDTQYTLMHRDFQGRNIINNNGKYSLIDFQSARKGPIHYDLASLLYHSKTQYTDELRIQIIDYFLSKYLNIDKNIFLKDFYLISLVRMIQTLGSYGVAGLENKKEFFVTSIPLGVKNFKDILSILEIKYGIQFTHLKNIIHSI